MNGISSSLFDPYGTLTRGMAVTILYRMEGSPAAAYTGAFGDVPAGEWYTDGVEWAASNGPFARTTQPPNHPTTQP